RDAESLLPDLRGSGAAGGRRTLVPRYPRRARLSAGPGRGARRYLAAHAAALRVLARQSDRRGPDTDGLGRAVRAVGALRLRHRLRRVLLRDLLRRNETPGRGPAGGRGARTRRLPQLPGVQFAFQALEPPRAALGLRGRRRAPDRA